MEKKVVILNGSPRPGGNTATLADKVGEAARAAGAHVDEFTLQSMDISPCDACDACQDSGGGCVVNDEMQLIYPKLVQADVIVIASPIYWFSLSAQTKLCIDRWYALEGPDGNELAGKDFGLVLTYGDSDPFNSGAVNAIRSVQDILSYIGANLIGMVYGSTPDLGDAAKQPELLESAYKLGEKMVRN